MRAAFALALQSSGMPFRALPLEMNFPTHRAVDDGLFPDRIRPLLLHHHHRLSAAGELLPTG